MQDEVGASAPALNWEEIDLYRLFANLLGFPSKGRFDLLALIRAQNVIPDLWARLSCDGTPPPLITFDSFGEYEAGYIALFDVGAPEPPVPLLESHYHEKIPAQQTVMENVCFYDVINLKVDPAVTSPDHLLAQLEFAASVRYLHEQCAEPMQRQALRQLESDFLERHVLSWLPIALARLEPLHPPMLPALFTLLLKFIRIRLAELRTDLTLQ